MPDQRHIVGVLLVAVCLAVLAFAAGAPVPGRLSAGYPGAGVIGPPSLGVGSARPALAVGGIRAEANPSSSAPISVSLDVNHPNAEVGSAVTFSLDISLVGCGIFYTSSIGLLTIAPGDGSQYQGYENFSPAQSVLTCGPPLQTSVVVDLQYAYAAPGTYSAAAQVNWSSSEAPLYTNSVTVHVSGSSLAFAIDGWFYSVIGFITGVLIVLAVLRWRSPARPPLPPRAA